MLTGFLALPILLGRPGLLVFELFRITAIALLRGLLLLMTRTCDVGDKYEDFFLDLGGLALLTRLALRLKRLGLWL